MYLFFILDVIIILVITMRCKISIKFEVGWFL